MSRECYSTGAGASGSWTGGRGCLACKKTQSAHFSDARSRKAGKKRKGFYVGRDGFQRRMDESFEDEANRRYALIMGHTS